MSLDPEQLDSRRQRSLTDNENGPQPSPLFQTSARAASRLATKLPQTLGPTAVLNYGRRVHDWYLMPEAYSEPLILEAIKRFGLQRSDTILDPFSGTGTTVLTAALLGIPGIGLEINPFLCFASRVKLDWDVDIRVFEGVTNELMKQARPLIDSLSVKRDLFSLSTDAQQSASSVAEILAAAPEPAIPRLHQWMTPVVVKKVLVLRHLIETLAPEKLRPYFLLALASILRPASNMKLTAHAFGSQIIKEDAPVTDLFEQKIRKIGEDLSDIQGIRDYTSSSVILHADARQARSIQHELLPATLAITSPPYLNNLDYTMQTRMELFFLRFINDMKELRDLRKAMVTCDAKAMYKDVPDSAEVTDVESIQAIVQALEDVHRDKNWGWNYAYLTTQYFGGMFRVLKSIRPLLKTGGHFVLIVGESAHSGVTVPVPDVLAELGERAGYKICEINVLRRRRSSSHRYELCESEVILHNRQ